MITDQINRLISSGQQFFTDEELIKEKDANRASLLARLRRLREKKRIFTPTKGFHVIIPDIYQAFEIIPAEQYIDQMMQFLGIKYYVGLLSAAAIHGASHQKAMVFQVCVEKKIEEIKIGNHHVQFIQNKDVTWFSAIKHKTNTGYINISSLEATCYDHVKFINYCGGINNVATNLIELLEEKEVDKNFLADPRYKTNILQKLGHILQTIGMTSHADVLYKNISNRELSWTPLIRGKSTKGSKKDKKWMILANESIEADI